MRRAFALAVAGSLALAGCVSAPPEESVTATPTGDVELITVGADETGAPTLEFDTDVDWTRVQTDVVWEGDGDALVDGQPLLLDLYGESLLDGAIVVDSYTGLARSFLLAPELLGDDLYELLLEQRVGARLLHVSPASSGGVDDEPPIALIIDVLPTRATGLAADMPEGWPTVFLADDGEPSVSIPESVERPAQTQVVTTIQGTGTQVREGSWVLANYVMVSWDGEVLDSSWPDERAPLEFEVGARTQIPALEDALIDQLQGSQVMILAPATQAYPDKGPVVLVVDILDVFTPEVE